MKVRVSAEAVRGRRENGGRTFKLGQKMGHSRCWCITFPVSLLKSSLTGLALEGGWHPAHSTGATCPSSGPSASSGLGAVSKSLQPAIQPNFLSAVSSFYLWQSQLLWANRQTDFCKASTTDSSHFVIICNFDTFRSAKFYSLVPFAEPRSWSCLCCTGDKRDNLLKADAFLVSSILSCSCGYRGKN